MSNDSSANYYQNKKEGLQKKSSEKYKSGSKKMKEKKRQYALRKKSVFGVILVRIFSAFSGIQTEYGEMQSISRHSVQMRENAGKMWTRITPDTNTFYAVIVMKYTKIYQKMENKSLLGLEKRYYEMRKNALYNYQKLFSLRKK